MTHILCILCILVVVPFSSGATSYDDNEKGTNTAISKQEAEEFADYMMERYAAITGAWYLNERCEVLDLDRFQEFTWYVDQIEAEMEALFQGNQKTIPELIKQNAKTTSENEFYNDCTNAKDTVQSAFELSKEISNALGHPAFQTAVSNALNPAEQYSQLVLTYESIKKCNLLEPKLFDQLTIVHQQIVDAFAAKDPVANYVASKIIDANIKKIEGFDCDVSEEYIQKYVLALGDMQDKYSSSQN